MLVLTKCPSAALRAELWMPVGWQTLEGANYSYMIAYFVFFCCLVQIVHSRGAVEKDPCLKTAFFGTQSKKRTECTDFFTFMQVFTFFFCAAHIKMYVHGIISIFLALG